MTYLQLHDLVAAHSGVVVCNMVDIGLVRVDKPDLLIMLKNHDRRTAQSKLKPLYKDGELILR